MNKVANEIGFLGRASMPAGFASICLAFLIVLSGCEQNSTDPEETKEPKADSIIVFFPKAGHDYLYLFRRTHPTQAPTVEACSVWSRHSRSPYVTQDAGDTVFRVEERRACYWPPGPGGALDTKSSDSLKIYYIAKNESVTRNYDTATGFAAYQANPPFDVNAVDLGETRKVYFYGDSLAVAGGTRNDLWLEGKGRLLYFRTYHGPFQNTYGSFEELRLLRYDSLEVTDSLINSYVNP